MSLKPDFSELHNDFTDRTEPNVVLFPFILDQSYIKVFVVVMKAYFLQAGFGGREVMRHFNEIS